MNSVCVYLLVTLYIDFNKPIKKLLLDRDRWTGAMQLKTGHRSVSGSAGSCSLLDVAPDGETGRAGRGASNVITN